MIVSLNDTPYYHCVGVLYLSISGEPDNMTGELHLYINQGDRMSVHYLVGTHNPAINTFSRNSGFIKQRFRLPTMLTFVGSFCSMFRDMCLK
jgi:hypothetical protein